MGSLGYFGIFLDFLGSFEFQRLWGFVEYLEFVRVFPMVCRHFERVFEGFQGFLGFLRV